MQMLQKHVENILAMPDFTANFIKDGFCKVPLTLVAWS